MGYGETAKKKRGKALGDRGIFWGNGINWALGRVAYSISPDLRSVRSVSMLPVANSEEYPSFRV